MQLKNAESSKYFIFFGNEIHFKLGLLKKQALLTYDILLLKIIVSKFAQLPNAFISTLIKNGGKTIFFKLKLL